MFLKDQKNINGKIYWDSSWDIQGIQNFSPHTTLVENTKWLYFQQDIKNYSGRTLEVGCGSGHFSSLLAQIGFHTFLMDFSNQAISCAKNSFINLKGIENKHYLIGDALNLPFSNDSIDIVLSCGLLEHFENPIQPIQEMVRVLRPGGLFYADICPKKFSLIGLFDVLYKSQEGWYEKKIKKNEIIQILETSGLKIRRIFAAGVLPPRNIPARGRIKLIGHFQKLLVERLSNFWQSFDGTKVAEYFGFYYYVTAIK